MNKKILPVLLSMICAIAFFSCKKTGVSTSDPTRQYFPVKFGKSVTYNVDSIYYIDSLCKQIEVTSQQLYSITDTFRDSGNRLSYIMNIYTRANESSPWQAQSVALITPTPTGLIYVQSTIPFIKMTFPVTANEAWAGNSLVETADSTYKLFFNWRYVYQNLGMPYNNGLVNYNNTVTVLEDDETVSNPDTDPAQPASRTYYKEIYAYDVGMVYREFTHWTYTPDSLNTSTCKSGYSVVMRAIANQ
jgi:hypothetical protein